MPPSSVARRERLADAAIELLARQGARGLTHRAVDAEAGEPVGTTSRYFRTRAALLRAVVERARQLHFAALERAPRGDLAAGAVVEHLVSMVEDALTRDRSLHLAVTELFVESTRRPDLAVLMGELLGAQLQLVRAIHRAAGIELDAEQAALLVSAISGIVLLGLTSPAAVGLNTAEDVRRMVRAAVATARTVPG